MATQYVYHQVPAENIKNDLENSTKFNRETNSWIPLLRQILIVSAIWVPNFTCGLCLGAPTVFIPQLRREGNSTDAVTPEMASWLSSVSGYAAVPWTLILPVLLKKFGRKRLFILLSLNTHLVFIFFMHSRTTTHLLLTAIVQGLSHAGTLTISVVSIVEYTSPKYRAILLPIKGASIYWGILAANAVGTYCHWRYIAVLGFIVSVYTLTAVFWVESPFWLATQGAYEECRTAHRWLNGVNPDSEAELDEIIQSQMLSKQNPSRVWSDFSFMMEPLFYKPMLLSLVMMTMYNLSGKQICATYSIDIIKQITGSETAAYNGMLILDGLSVISMYAGCGVARYLRRRTLLFVFGSLAVGVLLLMSLYLYLASLAVLRENTYASISLLIAYTVAIGLGPIILMSCLYAEVLPINYKSESIVILSLLFMLLQATLLKVSPYIFASFGMHGTFFFYGVSVMVCLIVLFKYLPETKDKTLIEIEAYFRK